MEDLETIFAQKLDRSSEKCKQTRHMNDFRNLFLYSQDQRQHHVYHKRAQGLGGMEEQPLAWLLLLFDGLRAKAT